MLKILIISYFLLSFADGRTLPEDEEDSFDEVQTVFHSSNVACRVQGTILKICRECDQQLPGCIAKTYSDCKCRDISLKNEGKFFYSGCLFDQVYNACITGKGLAMHFASAKIQTQTILSWSFLLLPVVSASVGRHLAPY